MLSYCSSTALLLLYAADPNVDASSVCMEVLPYLLSRGYSLLSVFSLSVSMSLANLAQCAAAGDSNFLIFRSKSVEFFPHSRVADGLEEPRATGTRNGRDFLGSYEHELALQRQRCLLYCGVGDLQERGLLLTPTLQVPMRAEEWIRMGNERSAA
jgi:hypothetical protein